MYSDFSLFNIALFKLNEFIDGPIDAVHHFTIQLGLTKTRPKNLKIPSLTSAVGLLRMIGEIKNTNPNPTVEIATKMLI